METEGPQVAQFLRQFCRHPRGPDAGKAVELVQEQRDILDGMLEIDPATGFWKHREALVLLHRKGAKTIIGSGLGLYCLMLRAMGTEIYFAANSRSQAGILKKNVDMFAISSESVKKRVYVYRTRIETARGSYMMVLGADAHQAHGYNPYLGLIDEYWAFRNNDLPEALSSGAAARPESMMAYLTTPGIMMASPLGRLIERYRKGDPSLYVYWPGENIPHNVDVNDPAVWEEYNIGYKYGWINEQFLRSQAHALSREEFVRLHLGGWLRQSAGWMDMYRWDRLVKKELTLTGNESVCIFIDGAWKHDSVAVVACTTGPDPELHVLKVWEKPIDQEMWRVPYNEIDDVIRSAVAFLNVRQIGADPFFLGQLMQSWFEERLPILEVPTNSVPRAVAATKRFTDAVMEGRISHDGNNTLRRHVANALPKEDVRGIRITRDRTNPHAYIDCAVAAIFAHDMASKIAVEAKLWLY